MYLLSVTKAATEGGVKCANCIQLKSIAEVGKEVAMCYYRTERAEGEGGIVMWGESFECGNWLEVNEDSRATIKMAKEIVMENIRDTFSDGLYRQISKEKIFVKKYHYVDGWHIAISWRCKAIHGDFNRVIEHQLDEWFRTSFTLYKRGKFYQSWLYRKYRRLRYLINHGFNPKRLTVAEIKTIKGWMKERLNEKHQWL